MIVATKMEGNEQVTAEEGKQFAAEHGCLFMATSSKKGDGVIRAFQELSSHVLANQEKQDNSREALWLGQAAASPPKKKGGCC